MELDSDKFKALLKPILDEVLDSKLQPLIDSIGFVSQQYDDLLKKSNALEESNKILKTDNQVLKSEVHKLKNEILQMKTLIDEQEQYTRRDCLEIRGIPKTPDEDTNEIVKEIASLVRVDITDSDISISHRLPTKSTSSCPPIIVKFTRRSSKDKLYMQRKRLKDFTTSDINLGRIADNKIYIVESLTSSNKQLFTKCLEVKKERRFKYIWTSNGRIFLRKDDSSPPWQVKSLNDLFGRRNEDGEDTLRIFASSNR